QPFGNSLVVMTLTGAQIKTMLEQQFSPGYDNVLHVSKGFTYTYKQSAPIGMKVDAASIKLNGVLIAPGQKYRVTVISYLAAGGDSFSVLVDGTERLGGVTDMEALEDYLADNSPVSPPPLDRITVVP
ncbi:MAG TPA: 5'-nucleotidase, partial [Nannocystis sp.]